MCVCMCVCVCVRLLKHVLSVWSSICLCVCVCVHNSPLCTRWHQHQFQFPIFIVQSVQECIERQDLQIKRSNEFDHHQHI